MSRFIYSDFQLRKRCEVYAHQQRSNIPGTNQPDYESAIDRLLESGSTERYFEESAFMNDDLEFVDPADAEVGTTIISCFDDPLNILMSIEETENEQS